jgi:hypothetical protein
MKTPLKVGDVIYFSLTSWKSNHYLLKLNFYAGMVVHTYNPRTQEAEAGGS